MAVLCIDYDLVRPLQNYDPLIEAIKRMCTTWCHPLASTWFISTPSTPMQVRDQLAAYIDSNDKLLVYPVAPGWAGSNGFSPEVLQWLQQQWPPFPTPTR